MPQTDLIRDLIAAVPVPALWIDVRERIMAHNTAAAQMFAQINLNRHFITTLRQPEVLDCIETAFRTTIAQTVQYQVSKSGADAIYQVQAGPVRHGADSGVLVSFMDMTHLEEAGQIRRDFVANVSHELRTPLTAMSGFIETLQGAAREDPAARDRFLAIMAREADRMNRLVHDLLSLSRVEAEGRQRPTGQTDLVAAIFEAVAHLEKSAQEAGVSIEVASPFEAFEIPADRDQILQVFINLIENAIKYGTSGGRVSVTVLAPDYVQSIRARALQVDVTDFGDGVEAVHVARLTERFYRVDGHRSREMGGTGLGLAIVKHIINRHRGRLQIRSTVGQGTLISVLLPVD